MTEQDDFAKQKLKAEADTATENAREAKAKADTAAANARKAAAEAAQTEAEARIAEANAAAARAVAEQKAKAEADKATADATVQTATAAKAIADAEAAKTVAQQKAKAEADKATADAINQTAAAAKAGADARTAAASASTAEAKAGIPDVPTLPAIPTPDDKSVNVVETGGAGIAEYTAAQALEGVAEDIGLELAWALRAPGAPKARRYQDHRFSTLGLSDERWRAEADDKKSRPVRTIWIMDSMTPSEAGIILQELRTRLATFRKQLDETFPALPRRESSQNEQQRLENLREARVGSGDAVRGVAAGLPPNALGLGGWAISTAAGLVNFGVQLVGALRSKYALYNRKVNLNRQALLSATAGVLLGAGFKVQWPRFSSANTSALIADFTLACSARDDLDARLPDPAPEADEDKAPYDRAKKLIERFDAYATAIMTEPEAGGSSPFLEAALFEVSLPVADANREDILLYADVSSQGADAMTGYGVLKGTTAAFLGFVQVYFVAMGRDGALLWSGMSTVYTNAKLAMNNAEITATTSSRWREPANEEE